MQIKYEKEKAEKKPQVKRIEVVDDKSYDISKVGDQIIMKKDGKEASLINLKLDEKEKLVDFSYVTTRSSFQGLGLAAKIVKWGFDWAKKEGLTVKPGCEYVHKTFLKKNPEYIE